MNIFVVNGKIGVFCENKGIVVKPVYSSAYEMVKKDPYFLNEKNALKKDSKTVELEK